MSDDTGTTATAVEMKEIQLQDLLRAGVHFGHQTSRWNPKMRRYIFAERGGIYLIDLKKTLRELRRAQEMARETVVAGKSVLFVCTKPQLAEIVKQEAERCGAFYVTERWLGGMLTNFQTIKKNIRRLKELERGSEEGAFEYYTKKEQLLLERERLKLDRYLAGIKDMTRLPGMVYVVDAKKEEIAVREADRLEIPIVAIADTNADPDMLTVPIAGNDDAIRSVSLITRAIADAIEMARRQAPTRVEGDEEEAYTYSSDVGEAEEEAPRRKRKRRSRPRRRPRPEVIAKRLHLTQEEAENRDEAEEAVEPEEVAEEAAPAGEPTEAGAAKAEEMDADPAAEAETVEAAADEAKAGEAEADEAKADEVLASAEASAGGGPDEERTPE